MAGSNGRQGQAVGQGKAQVRYLGHTQWESKGKGMEVEIQGSSLKQNTHKNNRHVRQCVCPCPSNAMQKGCAGKYKIHGGMHNGPARGVGSRGREGVSRLGMHKIHKVCQVCIQGEGQ